MSNDSKTEEEEVSPLIVTRGDGVPLADQKAAIAEFKRQCLKKSETLFDAAGISDENDEWYTPEWLFRALGMEFELDPCSPGCPPSKVPARYHLTKAENGLSAPWNGCVWLNPPFSSKNLWYERMVKHGNGIALMPARTESFGVQFYMKEAHALLFMKSRVYFERGSRPGASAVGAITTPPYGILLCAYGPKPAAELIGSKLIGVRARVVK